MHGALGLGIYNLFSMICDGSSICLFIATDLPARNDLQEDGVFTLR